MRALIPFALCCAALVPAVRAGDFSTDPGGALSAPLEDKATSCHQIVLDGATIRYTATAGHLTATRRAGNAPEAAFFYVAYTADGKDPATRPLTFCYNGGPGSASVWLHLGSFGPKRLVTGDPATTGKIPFPLVDNQESLLDTTDLVFVDAVGTGLSEAVAPNTNQTFWGVDQDAGAFRDFVLRYLAVNQRQHSPLYLFGESYGTPRTAVLANLLGAAGVKLAGVVLQSSILDYNANGDMGMGGSCASFLPSYSAVGAYYRLATPEPADLPPFIQQVRVFTAGTYGPAVTAWLGSGTPPASGLVARLHDLTGIGLHLWQQDLNLRPLDFQSDLISGSLIGRYDGRVSAPDGSPLASGGDPSSSFLAKPFTAAIASFLDGFLAYGHGPDYAIMSDAAEDWDFSHDGLDLPDTIPDLSAALARDPGLKVLSLNGYHDLATPFYQTELDLARLGRQPNLQLRHYNGGHMVYLDDGSRPLEKADLAAFYQAAPGWAGRPDHAAATAPERLVLPFPAQPGDLAAPLRDPYVPPARRHPSPGSATTGSALRAQVARKLAQPPQ
ncbi:MAG: peptidase S1 [Holophaga sp.]|nr:peptidase S1 [Holophaga sp.]